MPRLLVLLLACGLLLAGCGDDTVSASSPPTTPAATVVSDPTPLAPGPVDDAVVVAILSGTAAGGAAQETALALNDRAALVRFATPLRGSLGRQVRQAVVGARKDGPALYGQVVSIGCDVPPSVTVTTDGASFTIVPAEIASPHQECYAAVTTVAIVRVPLRS